MTIGLFGVSNDSLFFRVNYTQYYERSVYKMITLLLTILAAILLVILLAAGLLTVGGALVIAFGDLIIGIAVIWMVVRFFRRHRKNKKTGSK